MSISYHSPIQEVMVELKEAGWTKSAEKPVDQILNKDIKEIFRLVDKDRSGEVSRTVRKTVIMFFFLYPIFIVEKQNIRLFTFYLVPVITLLMKEARMGAKLLEKRFGIKDVSGESPKWSFYLLGFVVCRFRGG